MNEGIFVKHLITTVYKNCELLQIEVVKVQLYFFSSLDLILELDSQARLNSMVVSSSWTASPPENQRSILSISEWVVADVSLG